MAIVFPKENSETNTTASTGNRHRGIVLCTLVGLSVVVTWGQMIHGGFVSDDWVWRERAETGEVQRPGKFFRPACWASWFVLRSTDAGVVHGVDLLSHGLSSWQIGILTWHLAGSFWAGSVAGIAMTVLPTLHEAVCWSSARCGIVAVLLVVAAVNLILRSKGPTVVPVLLLVAALLFKETAIALVWGLPLLLFSKRRSREAVKWGVVLLGFTVAYAVGVRTIGAHTGLSGGYAVPFEIKRSLNHLGAYFGLLVGLKNTGWFWSLWVLVGLATIVAAVRQKRLWLSLWLWMSLIMVPFVRLGGPEQLRFLYPLSVCPVVAVSSALASLVRGRRRFQMGISVLLGVVALLLISQARVASNDWVMAGRRATHIAEQTASRIPSGNESILVSPPEWEGRAHLFRNGLFQAVRSVSGNSHYRGVSIPPSHGVQHAGELVEWLRTNSPALLEDETVVAWLYVGDVPFRLKGWRVPANSPLWLRNCIDESEISDR